MQRNFRLLGFAFLMSLCWLTSGCAKDATDEKGGSEKGAESTETDDSVTEALAKLSKEDQALAKAQKVCPVTDAKLGSMGTPMAVEVKGKRVFLCCEGCEEEIKDNPDKYLAKLSK